MRILFVSMLFLLAVASFCDAAIFRGGSAASANPCGPYVNGTTDGDTIFPPPCPANVLGGISGSGEHFFQFTAVQDSNVPPNNEIVDSGSHQAYGTKAVLANATSSASPAYGDQRAFYTTNVSGNILWFCFCSFEDTPQVIGPGTMMSDRFLNNTTGIFYTSMASLTTNLATGNTAEIKALPSGVPYYAASAVSGNYGLDMLIPNTMLVVDAGAFIFNNNCENTSNVCLNGSGQTLTVNGTIGFTSQNENIDITSNRGSNATINGQGTIDCSGGGAQGILAGWHTGTTTLSGITVKNCGGASGPAHGIYISNGGCGSCTSPDPTLSDAISNVTFIDGIGGGFGIKLDDACEGGSGTPSPCHDTHIKVYCDGLSTCGLTSPMDNQCGGQHLVDFSVFEAQADGVVNGSEFQWTFLKSAWDHTGSTAGCTNTEETTNSFTYSKNVFVADGTQASSGFPTYACATGFSRCAMIICGGNFPVGSLTCNANTTGYGTYCVHDSEIVQNWTGIYSLGPGPGVFTDSSCTTSATDTNTYYSSRHDACTANNWLGGAASHCAFPFVPAFITTETHSSLVAEATTAGCTGSGTINDPIRSCP